MKKLDRIYENYLNGNLTDAKDQIKKLHKTDIFNIVMSFKNDNDFMIFVKGCLVYNAIMK